MVTTESHTEVRGGHGNWISPDFNHNSITRGVGDWRNNDKTTRLPATRVARELLRKCRDATLGIKKYIGFFSDIEIDTEDTVWHGSRVIGQGSFGITFLYTAHDAKTAQEVDALVLKETFWEGQEVLGQPGLAPEAAFLADYNKKDPDNRINFLRRFAFNRKDRLQRFYLEYCPHPDLYRMKGRYVLFRKFLPELYIWHVFEQLLQGLVVLQGPPHTSTVMAMHCTIFYNGEDIDMAQAYCVHADLKLANVLSCEEAQKYNFGDESATYPNVEIADFGLAKYILPGTPIHRADWRREGSLNYFSPEQMQWKHAARGQQSWNPPPNDNLRLCDHKQDVWCVGMTVFLLMTMSNENGVHKFMDRASLTEQAYRQFGNHFLPEFDWQAYFEVLGAAEVYQSFPYSRELRRVVRMALTPEADSRPLPSVLLQTHREARQAYVVLLQTGLSNRENAKSGIPIPPVSNSQAEFDRLQHPESWEESTRLYFRANEINSMLPGSAKFPGDWTGIPYVHEDTWADPDWPSLRMPIFGPDKRYIELPELSPNAEDEVVKKLWHNKPFVDQPPKDTHPALALNEIRIQTMDHLPPVQRVERDYTNMSLLDILKAIDNSPNNTTDMDEAIRNADRDDLLRALRALDGNPRPPDPVLIQKAREAAYAAFLLAERNRTPGAASEKFTGNKPATTDRLMAPDLQEMTEDGVLRNGSPSPENNKKRKR